MRLARIKLEGSTAVYHCISRVVGRDYLLGEAEKTMLVELLDPMAEFCGLQVITYCMMSNHFHLLIRIPARIELTDQQLLDRIFKFYGDDHSFTKRVRALWEQEGKLDARLRRSLQARMYDVSAFMKQYKQTFSRWYNRQKHRLGTLWAERFKSVLVEDSMEALRTVAAYIDLNPIRAEIVDDPAHYKYCGYTAALKGSEKLRQGLMSFLGSPDWSKSAAEYRTLLLVTAAEANSSDKAVLDREWIRAELARGGNLALGQMLRLRIRHLTDGVIVGSEKFVNEMFERFRNRFGSRRKTGARGRSGVHRCQNSGPCEICEGMQ